MITHEELDSRIAELTAALENAKAVKERQQRIDALSSQLAAIEADLKPIQPGDPAPEKPKINPRPVGQVPLAEAMTSERPQFVRAAIDHARQQMDPKLLSRTNAELLLESYAQNLWERVDLERRKPSLNSYFYANETFRLEREIGSALFRFRVRPFVAELNPLYDKAFPQNQ